MRNISLQSIQQNPYLDSIVQITTGKNIIADGPLSLQYTKALNELYKKDTDEETGLVLESQANDAIVSKSLWIAADNERKQLSNSGQEVGMLYGVGKNEASISDVVSVTDSISGMSETERENSAIIIDASNGDASSSNPFEKTIYDYANENNINVFTSLEEYIGSTKLVNGKYPGTMKGKKVSFKIDGKVHHFTNSSGIKGEKVDVTVVVKNNDVYEINVH